MSAPPTLVLSSLFNISLTTFKRTFKIVIKESKLKQSEYYKPAIQVTKEDLLITSGYIYIYANTNLKEEMGCLWGADEIADWVKALVAKTDALNWIPGTHKLGGEK